MDGQTGTIGSNSAFYVVFLIGFYIYFALALQVTAAKTNTPNGWFAWIPILNIFLMLAAAGKPGWWFLLLIVPIVNIVIAVIIWMAIAEKRNKPSWYGILILLPFVNFIVPGIIAWPDQALNH